MWKSEWLDVAQHNVLGVGGRTGDKLEMTGSGETSLTFQI